MHHQGTPAAGNNLRRKYTNNSQSCGEVQWNLKVVTRVTNPQVSLSSVFEPLSLLVGYSALISLIPQKSNSKLFMNVAAKCVSELVVFMLIS